MEETVVSDLQEFLKLEAKPGETQAQFAERLARKANELSDDEWGTLEQATQVWVNSALDAIDTKKSVPLPSGIDAIVPADADPPPPDSSGEVEMSKPEAESVKKVPAKKAAKPAKKVAKAKPTPAKAKPAKAAPKAKKAKKADVSHRGPKGRFKAQDSIKVLTEGNPYREGTKSYGWFEHYKNNYTVDEALEAGTTRRHLRWAVDHGYLKIG